MNIYLNQTNGP